LPTANRSLQSIVHMHEELCAREFKMLKMQNTFGTSITNS
jgi:hypothetical protein